MMSQGTNDGFLAESELPEQILRYLDLKLDKEAFLKPTRETVTEIYTRFLDKTGSDWRKGQKTIILSRMLSLLKLILSHFNIDYEFSRTDIISPTRKRTTTYLNVMLYILAMLDERVKKLHQWEAQYAAEQQEQDRVKQEIANKRDLRDKWAYVIGQAKTLEEIRMDIDAIETAFNEKKKNCDFLEDEKCKIKAAIEDERSIILKIDQENSIVDQRNQLKDQMINLMQEEASLRETIAKDEILGTIRRNEAQLVLTQSGNELQSKQKQISELHRDCKAQMSELDLERFKTVKDRETLLAKRKQSDNEKKELVARAAKRLEMLRLVPRADRTKVESFMASYKEKIQCIF